ncbi:MAG: PEP-CTERM sorting domain-containing protein [Verrucomicrobia bacterium]|nr:PEP-CTERM sorting domain-containing protein [Verrucomicrobiota bacterium]
MKRSKFPVIIISAIAMLVAGANAAITTGSISFIGANSDEAEHFAFVVTSAIGSGEVINFTDSSYGDPAAPDRFRWSEHLNATPTPGPLTWTTGTTIAVGTVVIYDDADNRFELADGSVTGTVGGAELDFSTSGDNIFAYQGAITYNDITGNYDGVSTGVTTYGGGFLWGKNVAGWQTSGAGATDNSYLPSSLTDGTSAFALNTSLDNYRYNGSRSFNSVAEMLAAIKLESNWTGSDSVAAGPLDFGGNFTIVPEPAATLLGGFGLLGLLRRRRLSN